MHIWPCGNSPRSGSRNSWTRNKNVNGASNLSKLVIFSVPFKWFQVAIGDHERNLVISLWPGHSKNQYSGGIASDHIQNFRVQKFAGKFSPRIFGFNTASSSLIIFQRAKLSTRNITHLCFCKWRTFWRKNAAEVYQGGHVFTRQYPSSPYTWNPEETGLPGLQCLDHPPFSVDLPPLNYNLFPGLKKQLKCRHFSCHAEAIPAAETWFERQISEFFLMTWKS